MISHALTIVMNELNKHLHDVYKATDAAGLGNISDTFAAYRGGGSGRGARSGFYRLNHSRLPTCPPPLASGPADRRCSCCLPHA